MIETPIDIYLLIMTIANFILAFLIYFRSSRTKANLFYSLVVSSAAFWTFCMFMFRSVDGELLKIWSVVLWAATIPIVYFFLYFSLNFPHEQKIKPYLHFLIGFPSLAAFLIVIHFGILKQALFIDGYKGFIFSLPNFYFYSFYIIIYFAVSFIILFSKYLQIADKYLRAQLFFVTIGSLISALAGVIFGIFLPLAGNFKLYWLSPGLTVALTVFVAYAILKHRLFKVKVIITEFLVGIMGLILLSQVFTVSDVGWRILNIVIVILFFIFGYYLVNAIENEGRRREEAELAAVRERELRREAETLSADLKRLDAAKTQFLLSTQHHLRSPLSVIQGYLSMANEGNYGKIPARAKEKINVALEATQKLIRLVNDLLDIAHFQMNKGMAAKELTDVVKLIVEIIADLKKSAQDKNIYLRLESPSSPIPLISIDPRGIREAIYNIADNAIKYTQAGGVTVSLSVVLDCLRVSVADTGIGMNKKELQGLFNRTFERGEKARNVNVNGKGIGLYLAAQMVINNGGRIRAESDGWEKGSEFIIELPMDGGEKTKNDGLKSAPEN